MNQSVALTLLAHGRTHSVPAQFGGARYRIPTSAVAETLGWEIKDIGLCRGGVCIPTRGRDEFITDAGMDLAAFADLIGAPLAVESTAHVVAVGVPVQEKREALAKRAAPDFELPDLTGALHRLSDYRGRKILLVTWASWCGCREDLSRWREIHDEYAPHGLTVINVAQESSVEDARPFIERASPTHPSLIDLDHVVSDLFGFINVPTAVWIDESGMIARAPRVEHASNTFAFAHGLDCEPHLAALRRWVLENAPDMSTEEVAREQLAPTLDEQTARAEFALGWRLHQMGLKDLAEAHFARAVELSPLDWTIRRGTMRLRGQDPFGVDFAAVWQEWEAQGRPDYRSLAAARRAEVDNAV
jgi:peroxiredoxin